MQPLSELAAAGYRISKVQFSLSLFLLPSECRPRLCDFHQLFNFDAYFIVSVPDSQPSSSPPCPQRPGTSGVPDAIPLLSRFDSFE